jgi:hypothetical protein
MSIGNSIADSKKVMHIALLLVSLFFLTTVTQSCALQKNKKKMGGDQVEYALTVAAIRPAAGEDAYIEVIFNESARFYRLPRNAAPEYLELLRESEKKSMPVLVKRANEYSDIILRVKRK